MSCDCNAVLTRGLPIPQKLGPVTSRIASPLPEVPFAGIAAIAVRENGAIFFTGFA
jgi:hypothetical protein